MRAVIGNDLVVSHTFYEQDEETLVDIDSGTLKIYNDLGTQLGVTITLGASVSEGLYQETLTSTHLGAYDRLRLVWAADIGGRTVTETDYVDVVGGHFFALHELRSMRGLSSAVDYPNYQLAAARDIAEDLVDRYTQQAWVRTYKREVFDGCGSMNEYLARVGKITLTEVTIDGVTQDLTHWTVSASGRITSDTPFISDPYNQNVSITYVWGEDSPPADLKYATLRLARHMLLTVESAIPDRARMMQTEWGMFQLDTATEDRPTGLPEVDAVLNRYRYTQPWLVM